MFAKRTTPNFIAGVSEKIAVFVFLSM